MVRIQTEKRNKSKSARCSPLQGRLINSTLFTLLVLLGAFPSPLWSEEAFPFQVGETLRFQLQWLGLPAGKAELQVIKKTPWGRSLVYHIVATAESSKLLSTFYKVDDRMVSYLDSVHLVPWYFTLRQQEGRYRSYREIIFDHRNNRALYQKNTQASREIEVPTGVQDALSSLYYLRTLPLVVGQSTVITLLMSSQVKQIEVQVVRSESLKTQWGAVDTLVVQPLIAEDDGIFRNKRDLFIWLSNDHRRIPFKVSVRIPLGVLEGTLTAM